MVMETQRFTRQRLSPRLRGWRRAFLMLDTIVAMFVGGIVILGCYTIVSSASSGANTARQNALACNAARQVIENLRRYKATPVSNGTYSDATVFGSVPQLAQLSSSTASVTISTFRGSVDQAVVTIRWRAGGNTAQKSRQYAALLMQGGITP